MGLRVTSQKAFGVSLRRKWGVVKIWGKFVSNRKNTEKIWGEFVSNTKNTDLPLHRALCTLSFPIPRPPTPRLLH